MFAIEKKIHKRTEPIDSLCWTEHNIRRKIFHITLNLCNVPHGNGKLGNWEKAENAVRITHNIWRDTHKYINLREQFIQQCSSSSSSKQPLPWKGSSEVENFVLTQQTQSSLKREQTQRTTQIQRCAHRKQSSVDVAENLRHIPVSSQWNERERQNPNMWFKDDGLCTVQLLRVCFRFCFYFMNVRFMTSRFQGCITWRTVLNARK